MQSFTKLARTAASQYGLLTHHQIAAGGFGKTAQRNLVVGGQLEAVRPGLYRLPGTPSTDHQRLMAGCLLGGSFAAASHVAAARFWGMWSAGDDLHLSIRYPRRLSHSGLAIHRSRDLCRRDVTRIDDLPVTTPIRTLVDLGLVLPERQVRRLVDHELATGGVTRGELWRARIRLSRQGRNGVGVMGRILESMPELTERAESALEVELLRLLGRHELALPVPQHPVRLGGRLYRLDFAYPEVKVAIEIDGFDAHSSPDQFVHDRRRQNALILAGWTVLRFTSADLIHQAPRTIATISFAIGDL